MPPVSRVQYNTAAADCVSPSHYDLTSHPPSPPPTTLVISCQQQTRDGVYIPRSYIKQLKHQQPLNGTTELISSRHVVCTLLASYIFVIIRQLSSSIYDQDIYSSTVLAGTTVDIADIASYWPTRDLAGNLRRRVEVERPTALDDRKVQTKYNRNLSAKGRGHNTAS